MKELTCPLCNEVFSLNGQRITDGSMIVGHLKKCAKKHGVKYFDAKNQFAFFNYPDLSTKDSFIKIYEITSIPEFRKKYYCAGELLYFCDFYGLKHRTIKEAANGMARQKYEETCLKKYGAKNALSKGTTAFNKRNQTVQNRYGVKNVFQLPEIIEKIWNDERCIEKYGCTRRELQSKTIKNVWKNLTDDEKQNWLDKSIHNKCNSNMPFNCNAFNRSSLEEKVVQFLIELGYEVTIQYKIHIDKRNNRFYDIYLKEFNLLIEVNGDYWHCNPQKYNEDDEVIFFGQSVPVKEIWARDSYKMNIAVERGFHFCTMWESDLKNIDNSEEFLHYFESVLKEAKNAN